METPYLVNIATCTEDMFPRPPTKGISTMLFINQYWRCTGGVLGFPVVKDLRQTEDMTFVIALKLTDNTTATNKHVRKC